MQLNKRFIFDLVLVLVLVCGAYYFRANEEKFIREQYNRIFPCSQPIVYSIGTFDTRFGVSQADFKQALDQAIAIWEEPTHRTFFIYSSSTPESSDLMINLAYDYRQQTTVALQQIGTTIKANKADYDALNQSYQALRSSYDDQKAELGGLADQYQTDKAAYEKDVAAANAKGGATKEEYAALEQRRVALNNQASQINDKQQALNAMVPTLNDYVSRLNTMAKELNLNVSTYNDVGSTTGSEFEEGEFVSDRSGNRINIYQFSSEAKLVRVLAHELGHALGLEHVSDPKAIMYKYNEGINEKLTAADMAELDAVCHIK